MVFRLSIRRVARVPIFRPHRPSASVRWNSTVVENPPEPSAEKTEQKEAPKPSEPSNPQHHYSSHAQATREIDLDRIQNSLAKVNTFKKKNAGDKSAHVLIYEINAGGVGAYKQMTLKELLSYVNYEAHHLDAGASTITTEISKVVKSGFSSFFGSAPPEVHKPEPPKEVNPHVPTPHPHHMVYNTGSELSLRDLHRLDYLFNLNEEKSLLVRRHSVLFAMDPVRAIVMANRLLILAPSEDDPLIEIIANYMKGTL